FYYDGREAPIFCAPLLIYSHVNCAAVLENRRSSTQSSEIKLSARLTGCTLNFCPLLIYFIL
ncbi:MAG: hypothetical protein V4501_02475, partial [Pseudomonadota bacterium]